MKSELPKKSKRQQDLKEKVSFTASTKDYASLADLYSQIQEARKQENKLKQSIKGEVNR